MYFWQSVLTLLSLKRFRNIIVASVWALAGVYLLMVLLLSLPNVQRKIGGLIANAISEKIDAPVNVGKVNVALPNRVTIDDIAIFDRSSDSMLMANRVSAKIRLREIPNKKIVISSLQAFGIDGRFYKQDGQTPANYQFVIDSLFKKEKEEKEGWKVAFNSIVVRRSKLSFDRRDKESLEDVFSPDHVRLSNVSAHIFLNNSNDGIEGVVVKRLSFDEQSGLSLKGLTARASLARDNTRLSDVHIETKQSKFNIEEMALRRVCNDVGDTLQGFSAIVLPSQLGLDDVKRIVPKLKNLDGIVDFVKCFYDCLFYLLALHNGREESDAELESVLVILELVAEIAISSCCLRGYYGNSLGEHRNRKGFVEVEDALALQRVYDFLPLASHIAKGIVRVNILNNP